MTIMNNIARYGESCE